MQRRLPELLDPSVFYHEGDFQSNIDESGDKITPVTHVSISYMLMGLLSETRAEEIHVLLKLLQRLNHEIRAASAGGRLPHVSLKDLLPLYWLSLSNFI